MEIIKTEDSNVHTLWGEVMHKPILKKDHDGRVSTRFIFRTKRTHYGGNKFNLEYTTYPCRAYAQKAEEINIMFEDMTRGWLKGYFNNETDLSLTFVVNDYGRLTK